MWYTDIAILDCACKTAPARPVGNSDNPGFPTPPVIPARVAFSARVAGEYATGGTETHCNSPPGDGFTCPLIFATLSFFFNIFSAAAS